MWLGAGTVAAALACSGPPPPQLQPVPELAPDAIATSLYLIGDAGKPDSTGEPVLEALQRDLAARSSERVVVFLGDNAYPRGLPAPGQPGRHDAERNLKTQIGAITAHAARGYFVPGNHDWAKDGADGWEAIKRQDRFIDSLGGGAVSLQPGGGCPGPKTVDIGPRLRLVLLDTQWWLHRGPKAAGTGIRLCSEHRSRYRGLAPLGAPRRSGANGSGGAAPPDDVGRRAWRVLWLQRSPVSLAGGKAVALDPDPVAGLPLSDRTAGGYLQAGHRVPAVPAADLGVTSGLPCSPAGTDRGRTRAQPSGDRGRRRQAAAGEWGRHLRTHRRGVWGSGKRVRPERERFRPARYSAHRTREAGDIGGGSCRGGTGGFLDMGRVRRRTALDRGWWLVAALAATDVARIAAQEADTAAREQVVKAAGPRYQASGLHRLLFGREYRSLWSTPTSVPVLDLRTFAGGLKPISKGGGLQTKSLLLTATDGREFFFRSVDKDPSATLPPELRATVAADVVRDQTSSALPTGPLVVDALLDSAGILHGRSRLFVLPDDPALGEFRPEFAGLIGFLEERVGGSQSGAGPLGWCPGNYPLRFLDCPADPQQR